MNDRQVRGGRVASVAEGPASRAGLLPGDRVRAVDGHAVHDVLDWWWLTAEPPFTVDVERECGPGAESGSALAGTSARKRLSLAVSASPGEPLGVTFTDVLFEPIRECENACTFCFVANLPPGLRPALYVRDDDFRLSFLSGNFVTLTNMTPDDVSRITAQRLSPLHVSVHAVDAGVRQAFICSTVEDTALLTLDELFAAGIEAHVQIVLVPGANDGAVLDETLAYLADRRGILSVGAVPMGYTRHQSRWTSSWTSESAAVVLGQLSAWQERMRTGRGAGWVYPADEFYLLASVQTPPAEAYDGFPQYENGIGMVAAFSAEFRSAAAFRGLLAGVTQARRRRARAATLATVITGELFAPVLRTLLDEAGWTGVRVLPVRNALLGGNVSVTGLLGGQDIVNAIVTDGAEGTYLLPDVVVNSDGLLLDDVPAAELPALSGANVCIVGRDAKSLIDALSKRQGRVS